MKHEIRTEQEIRTELTKLLEIKKNYAHLPQIDLKIRTLRWVLKETHSL